jgi:hypothetical protein
MSVRWGEGIESWNGLGDVGYDVPRFKCAFDVDIERASEYIPHINPSTLCRSFV